MNSDESLQSNTNNTVEETNWPDDPISSESKPEVETEVPPTSETLSITEVAEAESNFSEEPQMSDAPLVPEKVNDVEPEIEKAETEEAKT